VLTEEAYERLKTIGEFTEAYLGDHSLAPRLLESTHVAERWKAWARGRGKPAAG